MANWNYTVEGYLAPDGHREIETVKTDFDVSSTDGLFIHATDKDDPEVDRWFWVYHPEYFNDWEDAHHWIDEALDQYGEG